MCVLQVTKAANSLLGVKSPQFAVNSSKAQMISAFNWNDRSFLVHDTFEILVDVILTIAPLITESEDKYTLYYCK